MIGSSWRASTALDTQMGCKQVPDTSSPHHNAVPNIINAFLKQHLPEQICWIFVTVRRRDHLHPQESDLSSWTARKIVREVSALSLQNNGDPRAESSWPGEMSMPLQFTSEDTCVECDQARFHLSGCVHPIILMFPYLISELGWGSWDPDVKLWPHVLYEHSKQRALLFGDSLPFIPQTTLD